MTKQITVRMPDELLEHYDKLAKRTGANRTSLIVEALDLAVNDLEIIKLTEKNPLYQFGFPDEAVAKTGGAAKLREDAQCLGLVFGGMRVHAKNPDEYSRILPRSKKDMFQGEHLLGVYEDNSSKPNYMDIWLEAGMLGLRSDADSPSLSDALKSVDVRLRLVEAEDKTMQCIAFYRKGDPTFYGLGSYIALVDPIRWEPVQDPKDRS